MMYYNDLRNGYSMNNLNEDYRYNNDCYWDNYSRNNEKERDKQCHIYNENKKEEKNEENYYPCYEGTIKLCPKYEDKDCNNKARCYNHKRTYKDEHKYGCHYQNRCGFCGIFRRW